MRFYKLKYLLFFGIIYLFTTCNNNSGHITNSVDNTKDQEKTLQPKTNFSIQSKKLKFKLVDYGYAKLGEISGTVTYKNETSYTFSNIVLNEATLEVDFADNTSKKYDILVINNSKRWNSNSLNSFSFANNPLDEAPRENNFSRTPNKAVLRFRTNNINIDKEIPLEDEIDLLPEWKAFQTKLSLR